MTNNSCLRLYLGAGLAVAALFTASTAHAQYTPPAIGTPATGEQFIIEFSGAYWFPGADVSVAATSLNVTGSDINLASDLGLVDDKFPMFNVVLKPKARHKIRFQYIPIRYSQTAAPARNLTFAGRTFARAVPVNSTLDWKAYEIGYEYDFISSNFLYIGGIVEAKYSNVSANLTSAAAAGSEGVKALFPAVGVIARTYLAPNLSLTGELTGIKMPSINSFSGHNADVDVYVTLNFTKRIGAQAGYRAMDVAFTSSNDTGAMTLKGAYAGGVLRY